MMNDIVRIGSRGSELALWQARWVQSALQTRFPDLEIPIHVIKTKGDRILDTPLSKVGDKGLFTLEIEQALLDAEIDIAVHSLKDLPTELPAGLILGAICQREDARDVFIPHPGNSRRLLHEQLRGAQIATGSLRRTCQLLNIRPDVEIMDIRGNLTTRMKKLEESSWMGMILARAGVVRLGWEDVIGEVLPIDIIMPSVGQGALAIEIRYGDRTIADRVTTLNHTPTAQAVTAERALLRHLEGGCQVPIGAFARLEARGDGTPELRLDAMAGSIDGKTIVRGKIHGDPEEAGSLGRRLAESLLVGGADRILRDIRTARGPYEPA